MDLPHSPKIFYDGLQGLHPSAASENAGNASMDISGQPKLTEAVPPDLPALIRRSGILSDRQFEEISGKVRSGAYPAETLALAERLVAEGILTGFQANRFLRNKTHGLIVGPYMILDHLGAGGRGRVFKAQHRLMGRLAALKIIAPHIASRASSIARFHREMRLIGRLDHPNVVRAFDADQIGDLLYIVMEYVPGRSLDHVIEARGPLPAAEVVDYMAQAALGLAHAHERGIVHRDVKPSNLVLSELGQIKILDLGLSALMEADDAASFATADGRIVGTVDYMSPEQAAALNIDGRSDLFSLGCTMYQLLSGRLPFPGETIAECLALRIKGHPTPITDFRPDLSPHLIQLLVKLMARRPDDRFQTAAEAAESLQTLADQQAGSLCTPRPALQPVPDPSVPQPDASSDLSSAVGPSAPRACDRLVPVPSTWFDFLSFVAAQSPVIALLIFLFELAVFGLGFALGHVSARLSG
jgi:serine/threonine-protein kinase